MIISWLTNLRDDHIADIPTSQGMDKEEVFYPQRLQKLNFQF